MRQDDDLWLEAESGMRVPYVAPKYDYGCVERGTSFEHNNFFDCLRRMGHDVVYFDSLTLLQRRGREALNNRLVEVVQAERPDILFSVLYGDEFDKNTLRRISFRTNTRTVNWFCDDHVRFNTFWPSGPRFNWVVTTAVSAIPSYAAMKYSTLIKSQWACNTFLTGNSDVPLVHDVTFVGQAHGRRREMIEGAAMREFQWHLGTRVGRRALVAGRNAGGV